MKTRRPLRIESWWMRAESTAPALPPISTDQLGSQGPARRMGKCKLCLVTQASEAAETVVSEAREAGGAPDRPRPLRSTAIRWDTAELIERVRAGDTAAFRDLFRAHRADVARLAHRLLGSDSELDDIVQDVFLQVHRSIREFRGQARFSTWLYRVTVNVVLMSRRAARSRPALVESADFHVANRGDERALPDERLSQRQRVEAFRRLLDRLTEKKRTVYILHELQGIAPAEIAEIVSAPVLTIRTRLFYARRELQKMLRDEPALAALADEIGERGGKRREPENG